MLPIKTSALLLSTLSLLLAPHEAAAGEPEPAGAASPVAITFTGLKAPSGRVLGALFDSEAAYGGGGAPVRGLAVEVSGGEATTTLTGLKPGRYALRAFHDMDGDGKLSTNPFGMPTEPVTFSNNARGVMGPASWKDAAFEVGPSGAAQVIAFD